MYVFHIELRLTAGKIIRQYIKKKTEFLFQHTEKKKYCDKGA